MPVNSEAPHTTSKATTTTPVKVLDLGLKISFAKPLLRSKELQDVARRVPLDSIVLETDAYPQPFKKNRARWTEPKDVRLVAECLAQIRGMAVEDLAERGHSFMFAATSQT